MPSDISIKTFISLHNILFINFCIFLCSAITAAAAKPSKTQIVIGLPVKKAFAEFVKCGDNGENPTGYCIDLFKAATEKLGYNMSSYKFECYNGTYSQLVEQVYYKRYDAAVGDITIMANRSNYVDFTQPYMESSLTLIAPVKLEMHTWLFVKPFTTKTWLLILSSFVYTMLVVWILERRSNPDFKGPRVSQFSTASWFTFSTLFFAHRENIRSNYTRAVMLVWFCAVFVIATSYQASLTAMLTVQNLKPTVTNIQQLKSSNATVGCGKNAFYRKYLEEVLQFHPDNIIIMKSNEDYLSALTNGTISAAFMELPYARIFLSQDPRHYKDSGGQKDRFGGFGFAFPIGSPLAGEFSKAFLALSEDGTLKKLDEKWFPPSSADSTSESNIEDQRLDHDNFMGLFLVTGITSTVILVFYFVLGLRRHPLVDHVNTGQHCKASEKTNPFPSRNVNHLKCLDTESLNDFNIRQEIQMQEIYIEVPTNRTRPLRQTMSFPGSDRSAYGVNFVVPRR